MVHKRRGNGQGSLTKRGGRGPWIARWYDHNGKRCEKSTRTTDKGAALRILNKLIADTALRREGVIDPKTDTFAQHARRPLDEHLHDFRSALAAQGVTDRHCELVYSRAKRIIVGCGISMWSDISASHIMDYLSGLRQDESTPCNVVKRGISAQTFNFYLQAIKQFARWMVKDRRAIDNPLSHLTGLNVKTDRRHDRRALTADELLRLLEATRNGPERYGMTGPERALLYLLAVETGLRAGELRSLRRRSFDLAAKPPLVTVAAAYSKRRREDILPLRATTAKLLQEHLVNKTPTAPAFNCPNDRRYSGLIFKADREAAKIAARDLAGRVADFHALRHTFITNLAAGGVHPKVAQTLARHSTIATNNESIYPPICCWRS